MFPAIQVESMKPMPAISKSTYVHIVLAPASASISIEYQPGGALVGVT